MSEYYPDQIDERQWILLSDAQKAIADLNAVIDDYRRLTKELDNAINGDSAATNPSLCDIVAQVQKIGPISDIIATAQKLSKQESFMGKSKKAKMWYGCKDCGYAQPYGEGSTAHWNVFPLGNCPFCMQSMSLHLGAGPEDIKGESK